MAPRTTPPIRLVINADDYGYFPGVDRGIVELAGIGGITATGVLATTERLDIPGDALAGIDLGVHLNLTHGRPLTETMAERLDRWQGRFPGVGAMAMAVLRGTISLTDIRREWVAQIERLLQMEQTVRFLNSHQHIHMLPPLFTLTRELADGYGIPHIRVTQPDWLPGLGLKAQLRNGAIGGLGLLNGLHLPVSPLRCIGIGRSGWLNGAYLRRLFDQLRPGRSYELVCHPGYVPEPWEVDARVAAFHDWEGELHTLSTDSFHHLLRGHGIELLRYRDLPPH